MLEDVVPALRPVGCPTGRLRGDTQQRSNAPVTGGCVLAPSGDHNAEDKQLPPRKGGTAPPPSDDLTLSDDKQVKKM